MDTKLETKFNKMEAERKALFNELKSYSDLMLNKKPKPEAWSVAEVISHLLTAEEASLKYIQKKTQDTSKARHAGIKGAWRLFLIKTVFNMPIKFKAPAITQPSAIFASLKELESRWTKNRSETFEIISKLNTDELKKDLWKHTLAGKMNIYQMLEFFDDHFNRHRKQIERTLAVVK